MNCRRPIALRVVLVIPDIESGRRTRSPTERFAKHAIATILPMNGSCPTIASMKRFAVTVTVMVLASAGCESYMGKWVTKPPNHGKSLAKVDRDEPLALDDTVIDHAFRVEIDGDAPASLSVWVVDPSNERFVGTEERGEGEEKKQWPVFEPTDEAPRHTGGARGTVMLLPGFYDTVNQTRYLMWARVFAAEGYRAVLVDQRGHGRSTGQWSTYGVVESRDMLAVLNELDQRELLVDPLGVAGVSFGAATAVQMADVEPRIRAMVLISTFTTMREVIPDFGRAIGFDNMSDATFQRLIDHAGRHGDFDPDDADVITRLARIDTPVLLIHGEEDDLIPIQHAVRLYHAADRDTVELVRVAGADHTTLGDQVVEPIRRPMLDWFERYLFADEGEAVAEREADPPAGSP